MHVGGEDLYNILLHVWEAYSILTLGSVQFVIIIFFWIYFFMLKRVLCTFIYLMYSIICFWGAFPDCVPLQMITKNFEDYPEHRLKFFSLLRAIATYCFPALIRLSSQVFTRTVSLLLSLYYILNCWIFLLFFFIECNSLLFSYGIWVFSSAIKACYGFNYMGISAYGEEHRWNWAQSTIGDAKEFSGTVFGCISPLHILVICSYIFWK